MFTTNFYRLYADYALDDVFYGQMGLKAFDGTTNNAFSSGVGPTLYKKNASYYVANVNNVITALTGNYSGVVFGTGNTAPEASDYKLAGEIVSTISHGIVVNYSMDDSGFSVTATYTITNTGGETITIREVGLVASGGNNAASKVLVERTVLDSPVTIEPAGVGQVVYTIKMNFPSA